MTFSNIAEAQEPANLSSSEVFAQAGNTLIIETRFGEMAFERDNAMYLPRGLFGYADHHNFGLADLPDPKLEQFKMMQSLTDPDLSFIVAPLAMDGDTIDGADIDSACEILSVARENAAILLIVATRKIGMETQISVNLRAPVIVDVISQTGWQHVLNNSRYQVRHVITQGVSTADQAEVK